VTVIGIFSSLIFTVMLAEVVALDARNEKSDFGATVTLFLSAEKGGGVNVEKMTWSQALRSPPILGLGSYAQTGPAVPQTPTARTSRRRFRRLTVMPLSLMVVDD
jgi:hypothetical protein